MIKKYFAMSIIAASIAVTGCSDDDDGDKGGDGMEQGGGEQGGGEQGGGEQGGGGGTALPAADPSTGASVYDHLFVLPDGATEYEAKPEFTELVNLVVTAGGTLADELDNEAASLTLFAPSNEAIQALPEDTVTALTSDPAALTRVLKNHVHGNALTADDISNQVSAAADPSAGISLNTLATGDPAQSLGVTTNDAGDVEISFGSGDGAGTAGVVTADGNVSDPSAVQTGVVHTVNAVMVPDVATPPATGGGGEGGGGSGFDSLFENEEEGVTFDGFKAGAAGNEDKLTTKNADTDPWSVFASTDVGLNGSAWNLSNHVITEGIVEGGVERAHTLEELFAAPAGSISTNGGIDLTFGGTPTDSPTVNGSPIKLVSDPANTSQVYRLDGILVPQQ